MVAGSCPDGAPRNLPTTHSDGRNLMEWRLAQMVYSALPRNELDPNLPFDAACSTRSKTGRCRPVFEYESILLSQRHDVAVRPIPGRARAVAVRGPTECL